MAWLEKHLAWQEALPKPSELSPTSSTDATRFLIFRPGDKYTLCHKGAASRCWSAMRPKDESTWRPQDEHWDEYVLRHATPTTPSTGPERPAPGLGNVLLSLVSAALAAHVSGRVLLIERYDANIAAAFGKPLADLVLETSPWRAHIKAAERAGDVLNLFVGHDALHVGARHLCSARRLGGTSRVLRIFSNQYFAPTLLFNPHLRDLVAAAAAPPLTAPALYSDAPAARGETADTVYGGGIWPSALRHLFQPLPDIVTRADRAFKGFGLNGRLVLGMHIRGSPAGPELGNLAACARKQLERAGATDLVVATPVAKTTSRLESLLPGVRIHRTAPAADAIHSTNPGGMRSTLVDLLILSKTDGLLTSRSSTFSYVARGLARRPATVVGPTHISLRSTNRTVRVGDCQTIRTTEPSFHLLQGAFQACRGSLMSPRQEWRHAAGLLFNLSIFAY